METKYEMAIVPLGKNGADQVRTTYKTKNGAEWASITHYAETEGECAYLITRCTITDTEHGWQRVEAWHILHGRMVTESEWIKAVRG